jgi:hypothetical protein
MGQIVTAKCTCGYSATELPIGAEMANFIFYCAFPVLCRDCQDLVITNVLQKPPHCPHCGGDDIIPYDSSKLLHKEGDNLVAWWNVSDKLGRVLVLTDGDYLCPACNKYHMTFKPCTVWEPIVG